MADFPVATNDCIQVTVFSRYQGQRVLNVFHYVYTGPPRSDGFTLFQSLLSNFQLLVIQYPTKAWFHLVTTDFVFEFVQAQTVHPTRQPYVQLDLLALIGTLAVPSIPSDTNITVSLRTLVIGRGKTGNKKFTGLSTSSFDGNVFTGPTLVDWQQFSGCLKNPLQDDTATDAFFPIVWSRRLATQRRQVFGTNARPEVRVLRSREAGKGV